MTHKTEKKTLSCDMAKEESVRSEFGRKRAGRVERLLRKFSVFRVYSRDNIELVSEAEMHESLDPVVLKAVNPERDKGSRGVRVKTDSGADYIVMANAYGRHSLAFDYQLGHIVNGGLPRKPGECNGRLALRQELAADDFALSRFPLRREVEEVIEMLHKEIQTGDRSARLIAECRLNNFQDYLARRKKHRMLGESDRPELVSRLLRAFRIYRVDSPDEIVQLTRDDLIGKEPMSVLTCEDPDAPDALNTGRAVISGSYPAYLIVGRNHGKESFTYYHELGHALSGQYFTEMLVADTDPALHIKGELAADSYALSKSPPRREVQELLNYFVKQRNNTTRRDDKIFYNMRIRNLQRYLSRVDRRKKLERKRKAARQ